MFLINQTGNCSLRIDTIDKIIVANPRIDDKNTHPQVIAIINNHEEVLGYYATIDDCKIAIDYISFTINGRSKKICMPKYEEVKVIRAAALKFSAQNEFNTSVSKAFFDELAEKLRNPNHGGTI